jgi:hypothetical protein
MTNPSASVVLKGGVEGDAFVLSMTFPLIQAL